MFAIVGSLLVLGGVLGGFMAMGGHLAVLMQPFELMIIGGAALGAFITSNPMPVVVKTLKCAGTLLKGTRHNKAAFLELLGLLYTVFKLMKTKGPLSLEVHIEKPEESTLFEQFPKFYKDKRAVTFLCDYLRMLTMGTDNAHQLEELMDTEIETHHAEQSQVSGAMQTVADGLPALGIVAAVLGVIKTMASITEPPEVLGALIGGALVGTFLGVLLAYGFVGPFASSLKATYDAETKYYDCIKAGLLAHMNGYAPAISVEFARKALMPNVRPTFFEVEDACAELPAPAT